MVPLLLKITGLKIWLLLKSILRAVFFLSPNFVMVAQVVIVCKNTFSPIWQCSKYESRKIISTLPHNRIVVSAGNDVLQVMLEVRGKEIYSLHSSLESSSYIFIYCPMRERSGWMCLLCVKFILSIFFHHSWSRLWEIRRISECFGTFVIISTNPLIDHKWKD
jgi:hypothetical protein